MTNDEIRELAKEAGFRWGFIKEQGLMDRMIDFAKLVAQHEREACAKVCDAYSKESSNPMNFSNNCADAIRARGQA